MLSSEILKAQSQDCTKATIPFTSYDAGWVIMCIGSAIGSGIVFMPLQMSAKGVLASSLALLAMYPAVYWLTKLYIRSLSETPECKDYASIITQYLGKNWGTALSLIYFFTILKAMLGYSATVTHDSATYLKHFGLTDLDLSQTQWYPLILLTALVFVASRGERLLFKVSGPFIVLKLLAILTLGALLIPQWNFSNLDLGVQGSIIDLARDIIVSLPFALFSIVFIAVLNPMNVAFRKIETDPAIATYRALRASRLAYWILAGAVLFFAFSFIFSITPEQARAGMSQNTSALALLTQIIPGPTLAILSVLLSVSAVMTSFFAVYLGFNDALSGIIMNIALRVNTRTELIEKLLPNTVKLIAIGLLWSWVVANINTMSLLQWTIGTFALVSCLIPCYLTYRVPSLHKYKSANVIYVALAGGILFISPLFKLLEH
ncbi:amino acid permease [Pseudomonas putida]|uniref:amino acid permease n=1 Tax=Pseudomonas putida TaxID=303 RepID=UPI001CB8DE4B|nr:amino acid permease [Pseudomonas putida]